MKIEDKPIAVTVSARDAFITGTTIQLLAFQCPDATTREIMQRVGEQLVATARASEAS